MIRNIFVIVLYRPKFIGHFLSLHFSMSNSPQLLALSSPALAERVNGWLAMIAFDVVVISYVLTGQIIPGIF